MTQSSDVSSRRLTADIGLTISDGGDFVQLVATGATVDAIYRAYRAQFGWSDGATRDAFDAIAAGEWVEEIDGDDIVTVANALFEAGMRGSARRLYQIEARHRADAIRDEAEAEATAIERGALRL